MLRTYVGTWCQEEEEWAQGSRTCEEARKADQTSGQCKRLRERVCKCCKGQWREWGQGQNRPVKNWLQTGKYYYQGWKVCALNGAERETLDETCTSVTLCRKEYNEARCVHLCSITIQWHVRGVMCFVAVTISFVSLEMCSFIATFHILTTC